jgi:amidase
MARSVEDLALALPLICGPDWRDPHVVPMPLGDHRALVLKGLRAAFFTHNGVVAATKETAQVVNAAAKHLEDAKLVVEKARPDGMEEAYDLIVSILRADGGAGLRALLRSAGTHKAHPYIARLQTLQGKQPISAVALGDLLVRWDGFRRRMLTFMEGYDVIVCPAWGCPAEPHGTFFDRDHKPSFTCQFNLTGWPAVVVRGGSTRTGLPIGVQVVARPWREDVALAVAQHLEVALGGWRRPLL